MIYTLVTVPVQTVLSLVIAICWPPGSGEESAISSKSALFIPVISSMVLVGTVWKFMLATEGGIINNILGLVSGIGKVNWLGRYNLALISVSIVGSGKCRVLPGNLLRWTHGRAEESLRGGEGGRRISLQQFLYITVPALKPITYLVITLGTIWSFRCSIWSYTMTGGGGKRRQLPW